MAFPSIITTEANENHNEDMRICFYSLHSTMCSLVSLLRKIKYLKAFHCCLKALGH